MRFDDLHSDMDGAIDVVCTLLDYSFCSNYNNWTLGKYGIKKISENEPELLSSIIETCINRSVDFNDDGEYSMMETIILYCLPSYFPKLVSFGLKSNNKYVVESAMDYADSSLEEELRIFYASPLYNDCKQEYERWEKELETYP